MGEGMPGLLSHTNTTKNRLVFHAVVKRIHITIAIVATAATTQYLQHSHVIQAVSSLRRRAAKLVYQHLQHRIKKHLPVIILELSHTRHHQAAILTVTISHRASDSAAANGCGGCKSNVIAYDHHAHL